jgi:hypothetical protein
MRPWTAILALLVIVMAMAVAIAVWGSSNEPEGSPTPAAGGTPTARSSAGPTTEPEYDYPTADSVGACFDPISHYIDGSLLAMRLRDCDEPHLSELLGIGEIDAPAGDDWPGQRVVDRDAEELCLEVFSEYVGVPYDRSSISMIYYMPSEDSWEFGDRQVWCAADTTSASPFTSSVHDLRE